MTISRRILMSALLAAASMSTALAADLAHPIPDPLKELVGTWYEARRDVTFEVKPNGEVVVTANKSSSVIVKNYGLAPGVVIARLGTHKYENKVYVFTGQCWTMGGGKPGFWLQPCPEVARAHYETRGKKPHWVLYVGEWSLRRKANLFEGMKRE